MQRLKKQPGILPAILLSFITVACIPCLFAQKKDSKKKMKPNIGQKIVLAENKSSQYKIVLPKHATTYELRAATVLQDYLIQVSGAALPIVTSDKSPKSQEIIIGQNERLDELAAAIDYRLLKEDGFVIWTDST